MAHDGLAPKTASVSELKKDPMATVASGNGAAIAILDHDTPALIAFPPMNTPS